MATTPTETSQVTDRDPVAPWWHTVFFLVFLLVLAAADAVQLGRGTPGHVNRMGLYGASIIMELAMVGYVWLFGLRPRGKRMGDLIGGRWERVGDFFRDIGVALVFWGVVLMALVTTSIILRENPTAVKAMKLMLPQTGAEMAGWVLLAVTAGFCEEFLFRGYLQRQFLALTGKPGIAVALQAMVFGAAHSYQGWKGAITITVYGALFGALAVTRKSLRPGMMQHAAQDTFTGIVFSLLSKHGYI
jgi:membrane protease YdiL (CAAX protease family)